MSFITLTGVSKDYALGNTTVAALKGIDLSIERGEFTAVWGPSGSGKSTLLNILATIDTPSLGTHYFDGQDLGRQSDKDLTQLRQHRIGIIFQNFNLVPVLTALENVMLPMQVGTTKDVALKGRALKEHALALLDEVGVADCAGHRPDLLSGGQRQRVAIARALITEPEFVIADEPTANLDSNTSEKIIRLLRDINNAHGTTFVFSTHHHILIEAAKRTIQLSDGCIDKPRGLQPIAKDTAPQETKVC